MRWRRRSVGVLASSVLLVALMAVPGHGATTLSVVTVPGPTGQLEATRNVLIARDVGFSTTSGSKSYWFFGDTYIPPSLSANTPGRFVGGSTAAVSNQVVPGKSPTDLADLRVAGSTSVNGLSRFLPLPPPGYIPGANGTSCVNLPATRTVRWISGATAAPNFVAPQSILITYSIVCVRGSWNFVTEGFGVALYSTQTNDWKFIHDVITPTRDGRAIDDSYIFGSPVFSNDGTVTMYSHACTPAPLWPFCTRTSLYSVTFVPTWANLTAKSTYVPSLVTTVNAGMGASIFAVSQVVDPTSKIPTTYFYRGDDLSGNFELFALGSPGSSARLIGSGQLPDCARLGSDRFCYAVAIHPELSPRGYLFVTYFVPDAPPLSAHLGAAIIGLPGSQPYGTVTTTSTSSTTSSSLPRTTTSSVTSTSVRVSTTTTATQITTTTTLRR